MATRNHINVTVWPKDSGPDDGIEFLDVQYISLVNSETFGIPALIAERQVKEEIPVRILYVNPENIAVMEANRVE